MRDCHALNASVECLGELVHRAAALAGIHGNHGNAREVEVKVLVSGRELSARRVLLRRNIAIDAETAQLVAAAVQADAVLAKKDIAKIRANDELKVNAVLNQIDGFDSRHTAHVGCRRSSA